MPDKDSPPGAPTPASAPRPPGQPTGSISPLPTGSAPAAAPHPSSRATAPVFAPDDVLAGRYRLVRFVAKGGMGEVYEAYDLDLRERVALKTIRPELAAVADSLERFKREIHLSRKVTHRNVCRIFDLGHHTQPPQEPGEPPIEVSFLTMELLQGETLSERLRARGRLGPAEALPIVAQMAEALATAHEAGIVHRDFKSANVMLVPSPGGERVVVADFGLAHATALEAGDISVTGSGQIVGTPAYMAPEQVMGRPVGPACDIYALGVVLFEMILGELPFKGESPLTVAVKRVQEDPPRPRSIAPGLDPRWEAVILRCLEREPSKRYATAREVIAALSPGAPTPSPPVFSRRSMAVAATAAVLLALSGGYALWRARPPGAVERAPAVAARRSFAVIGFKNQGDPKHDWLSGALSEMLMTELASGGMLRSIPGESVARMKLELGLQPSASLARDTLGRVRANLGADVAVLGAYTSIEKTGALRIDLRVQDTSTGDEVFSTHADGPQENLFSFVSTLGGRVRTALGVGQAAPETAGAVRAALPADLAAARLYVEGLDRLRVFDALGARELLEKAAAMDPGHCLAHAALARAYAALGYDEKARAEAARAVELSKSLGRDEQKAVQALDHELSGQWDKAVEIHRALFVLAPDSLDVGLRLSAAQVASGHPTEALATVAALRKLPESAGGDARIDLAAAAAAKALTRFEDQKTAASQAAGKARAQGAGLLLASARLLEGKALVDAGRIDAAQPPLDEARKIFAANGDRANVAETDNVIGVARVRRGDLSGARNAFEQALKTSREIGDRRQTAGQLTNLGNLHANLGNHVESKRLFSEALAIYREVGDRGGVATALNNLAVTLEDMNQLPQALATYEEARQALAAVGRHADVALVAANMGEVAHKLGRLSDARNRFTESLKLYEETKDREGLALTLTLLASVEADDKRLPAAESSLRKALAAYRETGNTAEQARVLRLLGDVRGRGGDKTGAQRLYEEAAAVERATAKAE